MPVPTPPPEAPRRMPQLTLWSWGLEGQGREVSVSKSRSALWLEGALGPTAHSQNPLQLALSVAPVAFWEPRSGFFFPAPFHPSGSLGGRPGSPDSACLGRWGWNYLIRQIGPKAKALSWFPSGQVPSGRSPVDLNPPIPQPPAPTLLHLPSQARSAQSSSQHNPFRLCQCPDESDGREPAKHTGPAGSARRGQSSPRPHTTGC